MFSEKKCDWCLQCRNERFRSAYFGNLRTVPGVHDSAKGERCHGKEGSKETRRVIPRHAEDRRPNSRTLTAQLVTILVTISFRILTIRWRHLGHHLSALSG